ncbi:unnamed protein product [Parnassius mnemosyne]|uniref:Uncharacterized protein n=1 Tax=Parnassius mnemosyne TaxID=213953 RepID=A0AAV1M922_9NEOP
MQDKPQKNGGDKPNKKYLITKDMETKTNTSKANTQKYIDTINLLPAVYVDECAFSCSETDVNGGDVDNDKPAVSLDKYKKIPLDTLVSVKKGKKGSQTTKVTKLVTLRRGSYCKSDADILKALTDDNVY